MELRPRDIKEQKNEETPPKKDLSEIIQKLAKLREEIQKERVSLTETADHLRKLHAETSSTPYQKQTLDQILEKLRKLAKKDPPTKGIDLGKTLEASKGRAKKLKKKFKIDIFTRVNVAVKRVILDKVVMGRNALTGRKRPFVQYDASQGPIRMEPVPVLPESVPESEPECKCQNTELILM